MNRQYGQLPRTKFTPPKQTRGGGWNPDKTPERPLTGIVQNQKVAMGEERLARTIEKGMAKGLVRGHYFRWTTLKRSIANIHKELDELIQLSNGQWLAVSVKGDGIIHGSVSQKDKDRFSELIIMTKLRQLGVYVADIKSVPANNLKTQELADREGRKLGIYR